MERIWYWNKSATLYYLDMEAPVRRQLRKHWHW